MPANLFWQSIKPVLANISEVHLVESAVYHAENNYAGRFDCLGEWNEELFSWAWKTFSRPKKRELITDYCLKITAYTADINELFNVQINQAVIAIALADQSA